MPHYAESPFERITNVHWKKKPDDGGGGGNLVPVFPCENKTVTVIGGGLPEPGNDVKNVIVYVQLAVAALAGAEGTFVYNHLALTCCPAVPTNRRPLPSLVGFDDPFFVAGSYARQVTITGDFESSRAWKYTNPAVLIGQFAAGTEPPADEELGGGQITIPPSVFDPHDPVRTSSLGTTVILRLKTLLGSVGPVTLTVEHDCDCGPGGDTFPFPMVVAGSCGSPGTGTTSATASLIRRERLIPRPRCGEFG